MTQGTVLRLDTGTRLLIVDPCAFGRVGLSAVLSDEVSAGGALAVMAVTSLSAARQILRSSSPVSSLPSPVGGQSGCLVVRLPTEPRTALALLLELGTPAVQKLFARWVTVLLTSIPAAQVRWLLAAMGGNRAVRVVDDSQSVVRLRSAVLAASRAAACDSGDIRDEAMSPAGPLLTARECRVLLFTLQGGAIAEMARRHAISHKTLYSQRHTALLKLGVRGVHGLLSLVACHPCKARP